MYVLKNNTCGRIKEVSTLKSSSFDCSETRVIFIKGYVSTLKSVHPASIAVKHALFSSNNTYGGIREVHPASIAVKHALFSSNNTCGRMKEAHPALIIFTE